MVEMLYGNVASHYPKEPPCNQGGSAFTIVVVISATNTPPALL